MSNPIMEAVMNGDQQAVEDAIEKGNPVDARDGEGRTALMAAVYRNMTYIAEVLILNGADINATDNSHSSVLYYASAHGNFESTMLLYEHKVKMSKHDPNFIAAIEAANEKGFPHIVELLIAAEEKLNGQ